MSFLSEQLLLEEHQLAPPPVIFHTEVTASFNWGECEVSLGKLHCFCRVTSLCVLFGKMACVPFAAAS